MERRTTADENYISTDQELTFLHLREQIRVADNPSRISDLPARLVQSSDRSNDRSFLHVGQRSNLGKRLRGEVLARYESKERSTHHSLGPFVDYLDQSEFELVVESLVREIRSISRLDRSYSLGDLQNSRFTLLHRKISTERKMLGGRNAHLLEFRSEERLAVRFLLEDEAREKRNDFLRLIRSESILENQFGEDQFVGGIDL